MPLWRIFIVYIVSILLSITVSPLQGSPLANGLVVIAERLDPQCDYIVIHPYADRNGITFTHTILETPTPENNYSSTVWLHFDGVLGYITHLELRQYRTGGNLIYDGTRYIPGWWWTGDKLPIGDPPPSSAYPEPEFSSNSE